MNLEGLNPEFKEKTDTLLSEKESDFSDYNLLFKKEPRASEYIIFAFRQTCYPIKEKEKSVNWERFLKIIFDLKDGNLRAVIESHITQSAYKFFRISNISLLDPVFLRYKALAIVRHELGDKNTKLCSYLLTLPEKQKNNILDIVQEFIPSVFDSWEKYAEYLHRRVHIHSRNYDILLSLIKHGVNINSQEFVARAEKIIKSRLTDDSHLVQLLNLTQEPEVIKYIESLFSTNSKLISIRLRELFTNIHSLSWLNYFLDKIVTIEPVQKLLINRLITCTAIYNPASVAINFVKLMERFPLITLDQICTILFEKSDVKRTSHIITEIISQPKYSQYSHYLVFL